MSATTSVAVFFSNLLCSSSSTPNPLNSSLLPFRKFLLPTSSSSPVVYRHQQQHRFNGGFRTHFYYNSPPFYYRSISPVMEWQDCTVKMEIDVPISVAYSCYSDREAIPRWMPFISSVKISEDKPDESRWSLKYNAFGQDIEYSWLARNLQPIRNQKIHWRSLEGLPNRGAVRFYPKGASSCLVELTVSYEVPQLLAPVASALEPFLQRLLATGLERFAEFARSHCTDDSTL